MNSRRRVFPLSNKPVSIVYTIGYQQTSIAEFLNFVVQRGIRRIIDVRSNPISRKPGFSKTKFSLLARKAGIEYIHVKEIGIEANMRRNLRTQDDYKRLLDKYEEEILPKRPAQIKKVALLALEAPSVLVCYESNPSVCHRSRLASVIARRYRIKAKHLAVT